MKYLLLTLFVLGINITIAQEAKDCSDAFPICSMDTYHFTDVMGFGDNQTVDNQYPCFLGNFKETNSTWMSFSVEKSGVLTFMIDPIILTDDYDFVLFSAKTKCNELLPIRCMASGETVGLRDKKSNLPCQGLTGLSLHSLDEFESTGCKYSDDNFLKFLNAEAGEEYILLVNNYNSNAGFSITFEGDCTLKPIQNCQQVTSILNTEDFAIRDIYPNPTSSIINVEYESPSNGLIEMEILDFMGRIYKSSTLSSPNVVNSIVVNVSNLPKGSYIVRLKQNGLSTTQQFVKI